MTPCHRAINLVTDIAQGYEGLGIGATQRSRRGYAYLGYFVGITICSKEHQYLARNTRVHGGKQFPISQFLN